MQLFKYTLYFLLFCFQSLFSQDGIYYSTFETSPYYLDPYRTSIHTLEVDPNLYEIRPVKAMDSGTGRESVLSIANRTGAIAAVNGGFFKIDGLFDGTAAGALKIKEWIATPSKPRGCIGWSSQDNSFLFDRLLVSILCESPSDSFHINGINRLRKPEEAVLFTPIFNPTTLTAPDGEELIISEGVIKEIHTLSGNFLIPPNGAVLSIQKEHPLFGSFQVGDPLSIRLDITPQTDQSSAQEWEHCDYIVGGTPLLIYQNKKILDFSEELTIQGFIFNKHARTAVGILPNGHWLFVVADKAGLFDGLTIKELTDLMHSLGCVYALNLDGGGSSTLVYENEVKNTPRGDKDELFGKRTSRCVSDAIIIASKKLSP